jgi:hypothetical protein
VERVRLGEDHAEVHHGGPEAGVGVEGLIGVRELATAPAPEPVNQDMDRLLLPRFPQDREPLPLDVMRPDRSTAGGAGIPLPVVDALESPEPFPEEVREERGQGDPLQPRTPWVGSSPLFDKDRMLGCIQTITLRFSTDNHQFFGPKQYP